jgi:hypothetical protein
MAEGVDETNEAISWAATASAAGADQSHSPMNDRRDRDSLSEDRLRLRPPRPKRTARNDRERTWPIAGHRISGLKPDLMACSLRIYLMIGVGAGHTCAASCAIAGNLATGSMPSAIP